MGGMLAVSLVIRNPAFFKGMVLEVDMKRPFPFKNNIRDRGSNTG